MTDITTVEVRSRVAAEFDRRHWPYEPGLGDRLLAGLKPGDSLESAVLVQRLPADYLDRNSLSRDQLAAALAELDGLTLVAQESSQTLIVNDNRYQVNLSGHAQITNSSINLDGNQINISVEAPKEQVLTALRLLLAAAFSGDWNDAAIGDLSQLLSGRDDVSVEDVRAVTTEVGVEQGADAGRVRQLLDKVATGALTGVLSTGLSAGLGQLLASLPI
jgi:hypothetical protein